MPGTFSARKSSKTYLIKTKLFICIYMTNSLNHIIDTPGTTNTLIGLMKPAPNDREVWCDQPTELVYNTNIVGKVYPAYTCGTPKMLIAIFDFGGPTCNLRFEDQTYVGCTFNCE